MADDLRYAWQQPEWPNLRYDAVQVGGVVAKARRAQGVVEGKLAVLGFDQQQELAAEAWSQEAMATAAIEGERLDLAAVRSSVARRLGVGDQTGPNAPRNVEGLLDIMDDAVTRCTEPLTHERLYAWQAALLPTGYSGMTKILVGSYRVHVEPMQIVSGRVGLEQVHYEAPPSMRVPTEMDQLLDWFNSEAQVDTLVKAALAHLWFETVHPFEDGNGRVGRALVDLLLARDSGEVSRLFRTSQRLLERRNDYYAQLEKAQQGRVDVTEWVCWFVEQMQAACETASRVVDDTLVKARFWLEHNSKPLNERQRKVLNLLLNAGPGGFEGGMSTKKYENIAATSRATASRELIELEAMGLLEQVGGGRSTRYYVKLPGWVPSATP
ncbi:Fic family protein [Paucibacter sp. PLA-PC-4]|uniref:Fic family protein n=1 Tax=Paucibacter sp. PLA-PC-4 TaxID=2993655 RepID=UPI002248D430|nr:Fic family protein [Paucibacter sp. PLA-PC-4]MCX2861353.1 Fic family protein [Paucibacter sp. PLA-PC-4]